MNIKEYNYLVVLVNKALKRISEDIEIKANTAEETIIEIARTLNFCMYEYTYCKYKNDIEFLKSFIKRADTIR